MFLSLLPHPCFTLFFPFPPSLSSLSPPSSPPLVRVQYLHRVKRDLDTVEDERTGLFDSQKRLIRVACRQVNRVCCAVAVAVLWLCCVLC